MYYQTRSDEVVSSAHSTKEHPLTTPDPKSTEQDPATTDPEGEGEEKVEATREELLEQLRKKDQTNLKLKNDRKADAKELARLRAIEDEHKDDQQKAIDEAVKTATETTAAEWRTKLLGERIMRRATGKLEDPSDVLLVDFSSIEDPDDTDAIDKAIDDLLEAKPHLAATGGNTQQPRGIFEQGPRGKVTQPNPTEGQKAEAWLRGELGG